MIIFWLLHSELQSYVSIKSLGVKLAPAVETAARSELVEVRRFTWKCWSWGTVGDVEVRQFEGFYRFDREEVVGAGLVVLLERFIRLLAGKLIYLVEVVQREVGYLSLAPLLGLLLFGLLGYQILQGSPLCPKVSNFISELRRLDLVRLQWIALSFGHSVWFFFSNIARFWEIFNPFNEVPHLAGILLIHRALSESIVDDSSFDVKTLRHLFG